MENRGPKKDAGNELLSRYLFKERGWGIRSNISSTGCLFGLGGVNGYTVVPSPSVTTLLECNGNGYIQSASQIFSLTKAGEINRFGLQHSQVQCFCGISPFEGNWGWVLLLAFTRPELFLRIVFVAFLWNLFNVNGTVI